MKSARPILDPLVLSELRTLEGDELFAGGVVSPLKDQREEFLREFRLWGGSRIPAFEGWSALVTDGTTAAFQDFRMHEPERPLCVLRGEYPYHRMTGARVVHGVGELPARAKLVLSHPFAATGNAHAHLEEALAHCDQHGISVLIDSALLFVSSVELGLIAERDCVQGVAFSLSKSFGTGRFRSGVCFTRSPWKGTPSFVLNEWSYLNHLSMAIHRRLMSRFREDYVREKYRPRQLSACLERGLEASDTVLFGLSARDEWREYSREGVINRLCLSEVMESNG